MKYFSKIVLIATVVFLAFWQLPWLYRFMTTKAQSSPFTLYSCVASDFVMVDRDNKELIYRDNSGQTYTQNEYDALLPMFYVRQLVADGCFPDSINGVAIDVKQVRQENFMFRSSPANINGPKTGLYPLIESMSKRVDLQMPTDVFRLTENEIVFIDIESNCINKEKSQKYTKALQEKGFTFPVSIIAGNPTTRKEYDNGYLLTDKNKKLFHLKMTVGLPYVRAIDLPEGIELAHLFVTEFSSRKMLALMTDTKNALYTLHSGTYDIVKTAIPKFNPKKDNMTIIGNLFDWTVVINHDYYAINANDYSLIKSMTFALESETIVQKIGHYIFPIYLSFTSSQDRYVIPRLTSNN